MNTTRVTSLRTINKLLRLETQLMARALVWYVWYLRFDSQQKWREEERGEQRVSRRHGKQDSRMSGRLLKAGVLRFLNSSFDPQPRTRIRSSDLTCLTPGDAAKF